MSTATAIDRVNEALDSHPRPCRIWLVGVPWFDPPPAILDALRKASTAQSFPYPPAQGLVKLREAVCELHMREGVALSPEQVVVTHGAKGGIVAVLSCLQLSASPPRSNSASISSGPTASVSGPGRIFIVPDSYEFRLSAARTMNGKAPSPDWSPAYGL